MIELIQVHEPTNTVKRVPRKSTVSEHAQFYTEKYTLMDGSEHPYSADINMMYGNQWYKFSDSVNVVFGNPDNDLKNRKVTFQEYADMKNNYNNRMVTDYEKESKPVIPTVNVNRLERLSEGKPEHVTDLHDTFAQRFFRFFGRR